MFDFPSPLIDVLSEDSFNAEHLPGAVNFCVYETAFLEKVRAAFPDPATKLTVYGCNDSTREAEVAVAKLRAAGYAGVTAFPGGLEGWKSRGGIMETGAVPYQSAAGRYEIDLAASSIHWIGRNLFNFHTGTVQLGSGFVVMKDGRLTEGSFTINFATLECSDLTDSAYNKKLIAHLRSDDFFAVDQFPEAKFILSSASFLANVSPGLPNYRLRGDFTLRGETRPLEFSAVIAERSEGGFVAQALVDVDRTQWGSIYGSGKFFARLGQHVVNDLFHLHLKIATAARPPLG